MPKFRTISEAPIIYNNRGFRVTSDGRAANIQQRIIPNLKFKTVRVMPRIDFDEFRLEHDLDDDRYNHGP